jgi:predicted transposase/invertase (TIGR01784 family)
LGRFLKTEKELESAQDWWLYLLKNAGSLSEELQIRLSEGGDILKRLLEAARAEGMDKKEKNEYFKNMRNAFDIKSEKWFAREDGIKEGMAKGKAEGKAEVAKELKALGINPEQIAKATGLSAEAIAAL